MSGILAISKTKLRKTRGHTLIYALENAFLNSESSSFLICKMEREKCIRVKHAK